MNDLTKLKELAERASALHGTPSLEHSAAITEFRSAANPQAILGLIAEIEEHDGILNVWRGRTQRAEAEAERLKAENEALRSALQAVHAEVDGNIRPLTRDLVNMVSGVKNGSHPNDIYDHCDEIDRIIDAALEGGGK